MVPVEESDQVPLLEEERIKTKTAPSGPPKSKPGPGTKWASLLLEAGRRVIGSIGASCGRPGV
jgi:hypothetical protein